MVALATSVRARVLAGVRDRSLFLVQDNMTYWDAFITSSSHSIHIGALTGSGLISGS